MLDFSLRFPFPLLFSHQKRGSLAAALVASALITGGCSSKDANGPCDPASTEPDGGCSAGQVCEAVQGQAQYMCFAPVVIEGKVFDLQSNAPIADARIVAIDANGAAASDVATSKVDGNYSLRIPSTRNADGSVVSAGYTLRADALGYQAFPGGVRPSLPVQVSGTPTNTGLSISNALTLIGLVALPAGPRGTIVGSVQAPSPLNRGVLVVGGGSSTISDLEGNFVLFNAAPGAVTVRGYAASLQLNTANVTVTDGTRVENVVLSQSSTPLSTVSGSINLVAASSVTATSVILVVKETFNAALERGEVPRGLRAGNITTANNAFSISNVPDGEYTVLAAFENDNAVRDPDTKIAGTQIVNITVPGTGGARTVTLPQSFKVTAALNVLSPGKDQPEAVTTSTPILKWADGPGEDTYQIRVFDSFGMLVWSDLNLPPVTGSPEVSVTYAGPALVPGLYYQFRATSVKQGVSLSRTEDLRGVFYLPKL